MKTEIQKDIMIKHLEKKNLRLEEENKRYKDTLKYMHSIEKHKEGHYVTYLQRALSLLEIQYADIQENFLKLHLKFKECDKKKSPRE